MTTMLRTHEPDRKKYVLEHFAQDSRDKFIVQYDVSKALSGMTTLTDDHLKRWNENWQKRPLKLEEEALDELYKITFPKR